MFALALIFRPLVKVRRLFFWLLIAYLTAEKLGATVYDIYYHGQYTWIVQYIADVGMAGAVGARFLDIGWRRWLGMVTTLGIALARPCVALAITALGMHTALLSTMPWFADVPAMILVVLFAVIGAMPSRKVVDVEQDTPASPGEKLDLDMMGRCIELSKQAAANNELPFASMICDGDVVLAAVTNRVFRRSDVTQHAEFLAVSEAQRAYGRKRLANCTIYSNVEPCVMCSMSIREAGIARVVFSIRSAHMGGYSKWNVLGDHGLSRATRGYFRKPPVVVTGLMAQEAEKVWRSWNPIMWTVIKWRGLFGGQFARADRSPA